MLKTAISLELVEKEAIEMQFREVNFHEKKVNKNRHLKERKRRWKADVDVVEKSSKSIWNIDFALKTYIIFILIDSYLKWIDVKIMSSTKAGATINELRAIFSSYGLPKKLVSDNGPNGAAERLVQIMKKALLKYDLKIENSQFKPQEKGLWKQKEENRRDGRKE